jgi:hypothetical protein
MKEAMEKAASVWVAISPASTPLDMPTCAALRKGMSVITVASINGFIFSSVERTAMNPNIEMEKKDICGMIKKLPKGKKSRPAIF